MKRNWMRVGSGLLLSCLLAGLLPVGAAAVTFQDVPSGHWAKGSIDRCVAQGFFQGQSATTFGLGQTMTRSAAVVVLDRFFGWEDVTLSLPYEDVAADVWYAGALRSAYANGAITGQTKQFRPGDPITREELAVMLIRALGYTGLAGVAQELPQTFTDVTSNPGYITMARDLGLLSGTKADTFSPDNYATREQVAVILMRLYDKLQAEKPAAMGIVSTAAEAAGLDRVVLDAGVLLADGTVKETMGEEIAAEILAVAQASGAETLLYISGRAACLDRHADAAVENIRKLAKESTCSGIVLEMEGMQKKYRRKLSDVVKGLDAVLGEQTLEVVVSVSQADHYDYAALSQAADGLILCIPREEKTVNGLVVAPAEPLEAMYLGVAQLCGSGAAVEKISLMITTTGMKYDCTQRGETLTHAQLQELLQKEAASWSRYYTARYGQAYLEHAKSGEVIWYPDAQGAVDRLQLLRLLGVGGVCMEDPANLSAEVLAIYQ